MQSSPSTNESLQYQCSSRKWTSWTWKTWLSLAHRVIFWLSQHNPAAFSWRVLQFHALWMQNRKSRGTTVRSRVFLCSAFLFADLFCSLFDLEFQIFFRFQSLGVGLKLFEKFFCVRKINFSKFFQDFFKIEILSSPEDDDLFILCWSFCQFKKLSHA